MSKFEMYRSFGVTGWKWRWRLRGENGEILASGESYSRRIDCENACKLIRELPETTPILS